MPDKGIGLPDERPSRKTDARWKLFAHEYVVDLNGSRAAIAAGYSEKGAHVRASELLRNRKVKDLIDQLTAERAKKLGLSADRILEELGRMAFANMLDYVGVQEGGDAYVDLSKLTREQAASIQEITVDEYTEGRGDQARQVKRTRFKLADKRGSLELLGKHLKMFTDKIEHGGEVREYRIITNVKLPDGDE
jgi:phage terminase small subunit